MSIVAAEKDALMAPLRVQQHEYEGARRIEWERGVVQVVHEDEESITVVHVFSVRKHSGKWHVEEGREDARAQELVLVRLLERVILKLDVEETVLVVEVVRAVRLKRLGDGDRLARLPQFCAQ